MASVAALLPEASFDFSFFSFFFTKQLPLASFDGFDDDVGLGLHRCGRFAGLLLANVAVLLPEAIFDFSFFSFFFPKSKQLPAAGFNGFDDDDDMITTL